MLAALGAGLFAGCTGSDSTAPTTDATTADATTMESTTVDGTDDGSGTSKTDSEDSETTETGSVEATASVGERVDDGKMSMVVRDVSTTEKLGEFTEADSGNTFVVVRLAVKNVTSDDFLNFSGFLQTRVKDGSDYTYDQSVSGTDETFTGGQLVPGEVSRGDLAYEVPKDASELELQFDFESVSFLQMNRARVDLESEADSTADVEQELGVPLLDPGETAEDGGVTVSVDGVEFTETLGEFAEAGEGNEFAVVDVTTENETGEARNVSTALQMLAKDGKGRSYSLSIDAATALDRAYDESASLADGEERSGKVAYEVPKGVSPLYWTFEFTLWTDGDKTFWQLR